MTKQGCRDYLGYLVREFVELSLFIYVGKADRFII